MNASWIKIITNSKWTIYSKNVTCKDPIHMMDSRFIYRSSTVQELESIPSDAQYISINVKNPIKKADSVTLSFQVDQHLFSQWGIEPSDATPTRLKSILECILINSIVQNDCIVGKVDDSIQIKIHDVQVKNKEWTDVAIVTHQTIIHIIQEPTESSIESLDKQFKSLDIKKNLVDVTGLETAFERIMEMIVYPILYKDAVSYLHIHVPKGLLLHGPPGTGKTRLIQKVVEITGAHLISIQGSSVFSPFLGESERKLQSYFEQAEKIIQSGRPCIVFIDEIVSNFFFYFLILKYK